MNPEGEKTDFFLKSHPQYPDLEYPNNLNCYVSFKTRYKPYTQYLNFEVITGSLSGDAYLAFGNDYGDLERCTYFHLILDIVMIFKGTLPLMALSKLLRLLLILRTEEES